MIEFITIMTCTIICALSIKKTNSARRQAQAILEDIEAHHKFLITVAASRRSKWRK
jgi:hypothetical protein